jgi:putative Mg2+ transporter-C (MgtC) family protein
MSHFINHLETSFDAWAAALGYPSEALLRIVLAAAAGGMIGLEREIRGRYAGFRTHMLVCLGSALVVVVSTRVASLPWHNPAGAEIRIDPARIAYGVMMGIGFLGAGTILHRGDQVHGLTTAAGLWCAAALGLGMGLGMYVLSFLTAVLVLAALALLRYLERVLPKRHHRNLTLRCRWRAGAVAEITQRFRDAGFKVFEADFRRTPDLSVADVKVHVSYVQAVRYRAMEKQLESDPDCQLIASEEA